MHLQERWLSRLLALVLGVAVVASLSAAQVAGGEDDGAHPNDEDGSDGDDYDTDEDGDEEDDGMLWDDEYEVEEWETFPNVTADELDLLSDIADYLSNMQVLLSDVVGDKGRTRAQGVLDDAFAPVKRDVIAVVAATAVLPGAGPEVLECAQKEEERARLGLIGTQEELEKCYSQGSSYLNPPAPSEDDVAKEDEHEDEALRAAEEREASGLLTLALSALRMAPLLGAAEMAELAEAHRPTLEQHALMLQRRERRKRAGVARCVDLRLEEAYRRADAAREGLASCLLLLQQPPRDEL